MTVFYPGFAKAVHNYEVDVHAILKSNHFKIVSCELIDVAEQFLDAIREHSPQSLVVVDTYEVHFVREMREATITSAPLAEATSRADQAARAGDLWQCGPGSDRYGGGPSSASQRSAR